MAAELRRNQLSLPPVRCTPATVCAASARERCVAHATPAALGLRMRRTSRHATDSSHSSNSLLRLPDMLSRTQLAYRARPMHRLLRCALWSRPLGIFTRQFARLCAGRALKPFCALYSPRGCSASALHALLVAARSAGHILRRTISQRPPSLTLPVMMLVCGDEVCNAWALPLQRARGPGLFYAGPTLQPRSRVILHQIGSITLCVVNLCTETGPAT